MIPDQIQPNEEIEKISDGIYKNLIEALHAIEDGKI